MIRNILGTILGLVVGAVVNGFLIDVGHRIVPLPAGADVSSYGALKVSMPLFGPEQFIFVFLAHALGTLVAALVAVLIAKSHKFTVALIIGVLFLIAGIINAFLLPVPLWYDAVDLILAYIPMALIGYKLGSVRTA